MLLAAVAGGTRPTARRSAGRRRRPRSRAAEGARAVTVASPRPVTAPCYRQGSEEAEVHFVQRDRIRARLPASTANHTGRRPHPWNLRSKKTAPGGLERGAGMFKRRLSRTIAVAATLGAIAAPTAA